jgi:integrase
MSAMEASRLRFVATSSGTVTTTCDRGLAFRGRGRLLRRCRRNHQFRHTYATLAYRHGVQLEVIGALLTHRSPHSVLVYAHPTAEDLRRVLAERGVLDKVEDLVG